MSKGRAFLIGNGYSLASQRLDELKGEITFAMNGIAAMFPFTCWRPTYYVMVTTRYRADGDFRALVETAVKSAERSFIDVEYKEKNFFKRDDVTFIKTHERLEWYEANIYSKYATSMLTAIQLADSLGYSPLYLLGVDGYREVGCNHFAENYFLSAIDVQADNKAMKEAYEFAKRHCLVYDMTDSEGFGVFERG